MDQDRQLPPRASNWSCVAHRRADLPETGPRFSQHVPARTTDVSASSPLEATQPITQAFLLSTLSASTIFESWLPMDSEIFRKSNCNARRTQARGRETDDGFASKPDRSGALYICEAGFPMLICWRDATRKRLLGQRRDYAISEVSPAVCGALQRARRWQVSLTKRERSFDICWNSIRRCVSPTSGSGSRHFSLRILQSMSKACERLACRSEKLALEVRSAISGSAS